MEGTKLLKFNYTKNKNSKILCVFYYNSELILILSNINFNINCLLIDAQTKTTIIKGLELIIVYHFHLFLLII